MLVAQVPILLQRLVDDSFQFCRQFRVESYRSHWGLVQNRIKQNRCGITAKRNLARGHLIQHGSEGKQIGASVKLLTSRLLGRHISRRAYRCAGAGEVLFPNTGLRHVARWSCTAHAHLGQPEIQNLGMIAVGNEDIGWLYVTMHNTLGVRCVESVGYLNS